MFKIGDKVVFVRLDNMGNLGNYPVGEIFTVIDGELYYGPNADGLWVLSDVNNNLTCRIIHKNGRITNYYDCFDLMAVSNVSAISGGSGNLGVTPIIKFKKGERVKFIGDKGVHPNISQGFTLNKIYFVREDLLYGQQTLRVEQDDTGIPNGWMEHYFKPYTIGINSTKIANTSVTNPSMTKAKFNVGDILSYTNERCLLKINSILLRTYDTTVMEYPNHPKYVNKPFILNFDAADMLYKLISSTNSNSEVILTKECTCESLILFRKGCQCGHIKKQQWGIRA